MIMQAGPDGKRSRARELQIPKPLSRHATTALATRGRFAGW